eukprot:jgi/Mesvir1/4934/Mv11264-RA.1
MGMELAYSTAAFVGGPLRDTCCRLKKVLVWQCRCVGVRCEMGLDYHSLRVRVGMLRCPLPLMFVKREGWKSAPTPPCRQRASPQVYEAAREGNLDQLTQLLAKKGQNVNAQNQDGETPLFAAAARGHLQIVQYLLEHKADINLASQSAGGPLHQAAICDRLSVAELLVARGANVDAECKTIGTPLFCAAGHGHLAVVKHLLAHGAYVDARSQWRRQDRWTPLHNAARHGHLSVVEQLISSKADVDAVAG